MSFVELNGLPFYRHYSQQWSSYSYPAFRCAKNHPTKNTDSMYPNHKMKLCTEFGVINTFHLIFSSIYQTFFHPTPVILNIVNIRNQHRRWYQSHRQFMSKCHPHWSSFYAVNSLGIIRWISNVASTVRMAFQWLIPIRTFIHTHSKRATGRNKRQRPQLNQQIHIGPTMDMMIRWLLSIVNPVDAASLQQLYKIWHTVFSWVKGDRNFLQLNPIISSLEFTT